MRSGKLTHSRMLAAISNPSNSGLSMTGADMVELPSGERLLCAWGRATFAAGALLLAWIFVYQGQSVAMLTATSSLA